MSKKQKMNLIISQNISKENSLEVKISLQEKENQQNEEIHLEEEKLDSLVEYLQFLEKYDENLSRGLYIIEVFKDSDNRYEIVEPIININ